MSKIYRPTLDSGINKGLHLLIFEKFWRKYKIKKWQQCLDWCKKVLKMWNFSRGGLLLFRGLRLFQSLEYSKNQQISDPYVTMKCHKNKRLGKRTGLLCGARSSYFGSKSPMSGQNWSRLSSKHTGTRVIVKTSLDTSKPFISSSISTFALGSKEITNKGQNNDKLGDERIRCTFSPNNMIRAKRQVTNTHTG